MDAGRVPNIFYATKKSPGCNKPGQHINAEIVHIGRRVNIEGPKIRSLIRTAQNSAPMAVDNANLCKRFITLRLVYSLFFSFQHAPFYALSGQISSDDSLRQAGKRKENK